MTSFPLKCQSEIITMSSWRPALICRFLEVFALQLAQMFIMPLILENLNGFFCL